MEEKTFVQKKKLLRVVLSVLGVYLFFRFALGPLSPFLLAFGTAALLEKPASLLRKKLRFRRGYASAVCTLVFFALVGALLWLILSRLIREGEAFLRALPDSLASVWNAVLSLKSRGEGLIRSAPPELRTLLDDALKNASDAVAALPGRLTEKLLSLAAGILKASPGILLYLATYGAGCFFIGMSFPTVKEGLLHLVPRGLRTRALHIRREAFSALGGWFGAQLRLMTVTFLEMTVGFWLMGIEYAALLALMVALIDALPILGTGTILLPWAAVALIDGDPLRAGTLGALYLTAMLVRSFLEPRLIGRSADVHPAASLLAIYTGFRFCGVAGMLFFPLLLIIWKQLRDKGLVNRKGED